MSQPPRDESPDDSASDDQNGDRSDAPNEEPDGEQDVKPEGERDYAPKGAGDPDGAPSGEQAEEPNNDETGEPNSDIPWSLRGPVPGDPFGELRRLDRFSDYVIALFDRDFDRFVTPQLVSYVYGFGMILTGLATVGMLAGSLVMLGQGGAQGFFGILALISTPFVAITLFLVLRVASELVFVAFRIVDDLHKIRRRGTA